MKTSKYSLVFGGLVIGALLTIAIPKHREIARIERRKAFQIAELKAMLASRDDRFSRVRVLHGTAPQVWLNGYVRTVDEREELRRDMVQRLGEREVGRTHEVNKSAIFNVQVIPRGTLDSNGKDFWESPYK